MEELFRSVSTETGLVGQSALLVAPRLLLALLLGGILAARPWRRRQKPPRREIVQTQVLMCVAAALIVTVIGDSVARAFGVVGLGGFIRFRTGIKDPRDAAVLFLLIGVGMACGMGLPELAVAGAVVIAVVLAAIDRFGAAKPGQERVRLTIEADEPARVESVFAQVLGREGFRVVETRIDAEARRAILEVEGPEGIAEAFERSGRKAGRLVAWERSRAAEPGSGTIGGGRAA